MVFAGGLHPRVIPSAAMASIAPSKTLPSSSVKGPPEVIGLPAYSVARAVQPEEDGRDAVEVSGEGTLRCERTGCHTL